ncbi:hypothetical protein ACFCWY_08605 [Streptomyces sp. NPDC056362]|uniref:hypothetical protein n=1 Tax=unclassified Streptomyces TaxID=2593676 RepID=UPI0035DFFB79
MPADTPMTGIANADELLTLARAFGLTVDVQTKTAEDGFTSHVVRICIPVPAVYAGKELGRLIAAETLTLLWTRSGRKGSRGRLDDATRFDSTSTRKLRTLRQVRAAVEFLGHESNTLARDTAPMPEDVVDAPHSVHLGGRRVNGSVSPTAVRHVVKTLRFKGWTCHQDETGTIHTPTTRYVPLTDQNAGELAPPVDERQHVRIVNDGTPQLIPTRAALDEMDAAMMLPGKRKVHRMSSAGSRAHIVYKDAERGTVELRPATATDVYNALINALDADAVRHSVYDVTATENGTERQCPAQNGKRIMLAVGIKHGYGALVHGDADRFTVDWRGVKNGNGPGDIVFTYQRRTGTPEPRPAAVILAADPIPVGGSVLANMPGDPVGIAGIPTQNAVAHDAYVAQERAGDHWQLPNHDDRAHLTRSDVTGAIAYVRKASAHSLVSVDTDGTVYVSTGLQAARYIPASLIAGVSPDRCPGCGTPSASNGDGPCTGGRSLSAEERQRAAETDPQA